MTNNDVEHRTVWVELPVTDMDRAVGFYSKLFEAEMAITTDMGPNPMAMFPRASENAVAGHLYPGKPAANGEGSTVHLSVPGELEAAMKRIEDNGGKVVSEVVAIPTGRFFYAIDTEGNSIGIFKA